MATSYSLGHTGFVGKMKERDYLEDLSVDGRRTLK
jgi:hypothetical protein